MHPFIHVPIINPIARPIMTFINSYEGSGDPTDVSASFGSGGANGDLLVIGVTWNNGSSTDGATVDGNAATLIAQESDGSNPDQSRAALYRVSAPAASSGTISISYSGIAPGGAGVTIGVWRIRGLANDTPTDDALGVSPTLNVSQDGVVIGNASYDNTGTITFAGVDEDYDTTRHAGAGRDNIDADATYTPSASGPGGSAAAVWAAWR